MAPGEAMLIEPPERADTHSNPSRFPPAGKIHSQPTEAHRSLQWVRSQGGRSCQTVGHQKARGFFPPIATATPDLLSLPPLPGASWHLPRGLVTMPLSCPGSAGGHSGSVFAESPVEHVPTGGGAPQSRPSASTRGSKSLTIGKGREGSPSVSDAQRSFVS